MINWNIIINTTILDILSYTNDSPRKVKKGILIDFQVTNDDIAGFCGISTRNSVNRILRGLREQNVISMVYQKILILDVDYLKQFVQA